MGESGCPMPFFQRACRTSTCLLVFLGLLSAAAQTPPAHAPIEVTVVDENNAAVSGAQVVVQEPGKPPALLTTDFNGRVSFEPQGNASYSLRVQRAGFYASTIDENDPATRDIRIVLNHEQM